MLAVVLKQVAPMWVEEEFQQAESWAAVLVQEVPMQLVEFQVEVLMQVEGFQSAVSEWVMRASSVVMAAAVDPREAPCMLTRGLAWLGAWLGQRSKQILGVELVQDLLTRAVA